jgi:hypothetical protein
MDFYSVLIISKSRYFRLELTSILPIFDDVDITIILQIILVGKTYQNIQQKATRSRVAFYVLPLYFFYFCRG